MRMKRFAQGLLLDLQSLEEDNINKFDSDSLLASKKIERELIDLLNRYKNSNRKLKNEFKHFEKFLKDFWEKIAFTSFSYHAEKLTKGHYCCILLAECLIQEITKETDSFKNKFDLLMPKLAMCNFSNYVMNELNKITGEDEATNDLFLLFESKIVMDKLKLLLKEYQYSDKDISAEHLQPFITLIKERSEFIKQSDFTYFFNPKTHANLALKMLGQLIHSIFNIYLFHSLDENISTFLTPVSPYQVSGRRENNFIKENLLQKLKQEETLNESAKKYIPLLQTINMTVGKLADFLLEEIKSLPKDHLESLNLFVYLESKHSLIMLKKLLKTMLGNMDPVNYHGINPLIEFLRNRWERISSTEASYQECPHSAANLICVSLADHLSLIGYKINFLNRNRQRLLTPLSFKMLKTEDSELKLCTVILEDYLNSNDFIQELIHLDKSKWKEFVSTVDLKGLIQLISNKQAATVSELLLLSFDFDNNEERSKALLYCIFEIYIRDRQEAGGKYKTFAGAAFSLFTTIPSLLDKKESVDVMQKSLIGDISLVQIQQELEDSNSELGKYRHFLEDSTLKNCITLLKQAIQVIMHANTYELAAKSSMKLN